MPSRKRKKEKKTTIITLISCKYKKQDLHWFWTIAGFKYSQTISEYQLDCFIYMWLAFVTYHKNDHVYPEYENILNYCCISVGVLGVIWEKVVHVVLCFTYLSGWRGMYDHASVLCNRLRPMRCCLQITIWILNLGIELVLGTRVKSADVKRKTLLTATGETISYKILVVATGARVLKLILLGFLHFILSLLL